MRVASLVTVATVALLILVPAARGADGFCDSGVAYDYSRPLREMPPLRQVSQDRNLPFGPRGVYLYPSVGGQVLLPGEGGRVGFVLKIPFRSARFGNPNLPRLNWLVTSKLARVSAEGRVVEVLGWWRRQILGPSDNGGFGFVKPQDLGFYRVEIVFRNGAGSRLGRFGEYFRVLPTVTDVRLSLDKPSYRPGEVVSGCFENFGTTTVYYGACGLYLEYFDGSQWASAYREPMVCPAIALALGPGAAARLSGTIPTSAPPGQYRASATAEAATEFPVVR